MLKANEFNIEDRRERLRELLQQEELGYLQEMADKEETVIERQAKMRERAKLLKEKREEERLSFVHDKLEQQFRDQCEELRSTMSKRHQDEVAAERMEQLRIKSDQEQALKTEEDMYAAMWYEDMEAKARREEENTKKQMAANLETLEVLQQQMAALEVQRIEERELVKEEAKILEERTQLRALEEQHALEEKRRKQEEVRNMYGQSLQMKKEKQAREMQEQLAFDLKILEQLLEESKNEAMETVQRKRELREEDRRYRTYLKQMKETERQRELELERVCDAEVEKMWDKKVKQWRLEKDARRKLMEDVMESRRHQLMEKLHVNERRQEEARREREELTQKIEDNKRLEKSQVEKLKAQNEAHQSDLIGQMEYNRRLQDADVVEQQRMFLAEQEAELEYRRKVEEMRNKPVIEKMHPMRRRQYQASGHFS